MGSGESSFSTYVCGCRYDCLCAAAVLTLALVGLDTNMETY